jgi:hypothetical protein
MLLEWAERNVKLLPGLLLGATVTAVAVGLWIGSALAEKAPLESSRISDNGTLLVVMQDGCGPCTYFAENIGPKYRRSEQAEKAPLRYIDIRDLSANKTYQTKGAFATPTLLMIDGFGREVGRSVGSPHTVDDLKQMVDRHLPRMLRKGV